MKALVFTGPHALEIRDVDPPTPREGQAIVAIERCGICGSDMHAYHGEDPRRVPPMTLGHEAVGLVETGVLAGRRVAVNPVIGCGRCALCRSDREHLCEKRELIGMARAGAFAERIAVVERNLTVLPDGLATERAVLAEPLACAVHTVRLGLRHAGQAPEALSAIVLGGGAIGLLSYLAFRAAGVSALRIAETNPSRRETLAALFGDTVYDPIAAPAPDSAADIVLDAVGSGATRRAASAIVRPGGVIAHIGLQDSAEGLDVRRLTLREIAFVGTYCYTTADFAEAVRLLATGAVDEAGWTEIRPLDAGPQSFQDIDRGQAPPKIVLTL